MKSLVLNFESEGLASKQPNKGFNLCKCKFLLHLILIVVFFHISFGSWQLVQQIIPVNETPIV